MTSQWSGHPGVAAEWNFKIFDLKAPPEVASSSCHFCGTLPLPPGDSRHHLEYECTLLHLLFPEPGTHQRQERISTDRLSPLEGGSLLPSPLLPCSQCRKIHG